MRLGISCQCTDLEVSGDGLTDTLASICISVPREDDGALDSSAVAWRKGDRRDRDHCGATLNGLSGILQKRAYWGVWSSSERAFSGT
jgi:hypothetical protein